MQSKVLVVGDSILDVTVYSDIDGTSLETPTLKARFSEKTIDFGGCSNVVCNLGELLDNPKDITYITAIGDDGYDECYKALGAKVDLQGLYCEGSRNNVKERYWIKKPGALKKESYKYFQLNTTDDRLINPEQEAFVVEMACQVIQNVDIVLLIDYRHGLYTETLAPTLIQKAHEHNKPVICSSQMNFNQSQFTGADLIILNEHEAAGNLDSNEDITDLPGKLQANICVTLGPRGCELLLTDGTHIKSEGFKVDNGDPCGAGDSFTACLALTDWQSNPERSLKMSNFWASRAVQQPGTTVPKKEQLDDFLESIDNE